MHGTGAPALRLRCESGAAIRAEASPGLAIQPEGLRAPLAGAEFRVLSEVKPRMLRLRHHCEVFDSVVEFVAVDVMDHFAWAEAASQGTLYNKAVLSGAALAITTAALAIQRRRLLAQAPHAGIRARSAARPGGV